MKEKKSFFFVISSFRRLTRKQIDDIIKGVIYTPLCTREWGGRILNFNLLHTNSAAGHTQRANPSNPISYTLYVQTRWRKGARSCAVRRRKDSNAESFTWIVWLQSLLPVICCMVLGSLSELIFATPIILLKTMCGYA